MKQYYSLGENKLCFDFVTEVAQHRSVETMVDTER